MEVHYYRRLAYVLVCLGCVAIVASSLLARFDRFVLDRQFGWLRDLPSNPRPAAAPAVVVVGIDEATVAGFAEPLALWHHHIGDFLSAMARVRPTAVGLDVNLPERSFDQLVPGYDRALLQGLVAMRRAEVPVVLGVTVNARGQAREIFSPVVSVAGSRSLGFTLWRLDIDQVVRQFGEGLAADGAPVPTLVGGIVRSIYSGAANAGDTVDARLRPGFIDYAVGETFDYVPLGTLVARWRAGEGEQLRTELGGKVVLLGSVLPFVDRHYQPVDLASWETNRGFAPGVLIHAQALRSALGHGFIRELPWWGLALLGLLASLMWWVGGRWHISATLTFVGIGVLAALGTYLLTRQWFVPLVSVAAAMALASFGRAGFETAGLLIERRRLRRAFSGLVSPSVLDQVLSGTLPETARVRACVLFSDIRGFTSRSEEMDPGAVIEFLNLYFEEMVEAIHEAGGTLDKFMGDGIMAFFGAPLPQDDVCARGVEAAWGMLGALARFNTRLQGMGQAPVRIGVGLHVGEIVVGHVGSRSRREYTAVGDVVNTASRLEGLTKDQGMTLIVSQAVYEELDSQARSHFALVGEVEVRGRSDMTVWGSTADVAQ